MNQDQKESLSNVSQSVGGIESASITTSKFLINKQEEQNCSMVNGLERLSDLVQQKNPNDREVYFNDCAVGG